MKRRSWKRKAVVAFATMAALGGVSAPVILAADNATTIRVGNLVVHAGVAMNPTALPKDTMAPIVVNASGSAETADGTHVPPAQTLNLQVDRQIAVDSTGLPACTAVKIENTIPSQAMHACGESLVGKGFATAQVEFPDSAPINTKGPLLVFNGPSPAGQSELPKMYFYAYVDVPVPTTVLVTATLSKASGKYGFQISAKVPVVAGGSGSLTGFGLKVDRRWTYKGQQHSYLNAECAAGHFFYHVDADFGGGTDLSGTLVDGCQTKGLK